MRSYFVYVCVLWSFVCWSGITFDWGLGTLMIMFSIYVLLQRSLTPICRIAILVHTIKHSSFTIRALKLWDYVFWPFFFWSASMTRDCQCLSDRTTTRWLIYSQWKIYSDIDLALKWFLVTFSEKCKFYCHNKSSFSYFTWHLVC